MTNRPELIFALVGAVGTNLSSVTELFGAELARFGYKAIPIRLSRLMADAGYFSELLDISRKKEDERIHLSMDVGDKIRESMKSGDALVRMAIAKIRSIRREENHPDSQLNETAFIIHSLKHPEEVIRLRKIYQSQVVIVSVYSPKEQRIKSLNHRIAMSHSSLNEELFRENSEDLIDRDEKESRKEYGQNVRDTFPMADIFLDATEGQNIQGQVTRTIEIVFGHPFKTPRSDEAGMFYARAASLRSADLSRQVGAVIVNDDSEIIATGCNEVPFAGGGSLWEDKISGNISDNRDFKLGYDPSARMKDELIKEVFVRFPKDWFSEKVNNWSIDEKITQSLHVEDAPLRGTRIASILEFGRIVHAEMSAITEAARRGISVKGATLYCTTFPCHMCARHLIAAGLARVVYIEPYPKSITKELYHDNVDIDNENPSKANVVTFSPFVGIAPLRFIDFFDMRPRKDSRGHVIEWHPREASPRVIVNDTLSLEAVVLESLNKYLSSLEGAAKAHAPETQSESRTEQSDGEEAE